MLMESDVLPLYHTSTVTIVLGISIISTITKNPDNLVVTSAVFLIDPTNHSLRKLPHYENWL